MLGLGQGIVIFLIVHSQLGLHSGFLVEHLPDGGGLVPAMFLIGERLQSSIESKRKGNRYGGRFLVSHSADSVTAKMREQENSMLTACMIQSYT